MSAAKRRRGRRQTATTWWGFHRLADAWAQRVVAHAEVRPGELVVDVGAGTGALTAPLVATGARVIAVELHRDRERTLRHRFADAAVTVVHADGADLRLPRRPFRVVANPPFAISTALLRRLLAPGSRLVRADLVVPRHVAVRWTGERAPGVRRWSREFSTSITFRVPRHAFHPAAPADAVVLCLERRATTGEGRGPRARRRIRGG